jgi:SAM-dependent methyltransferase
MTISPDYQRDWPAYFQAVHDKPPRDTLLRALDLLGPGNHRLAFDVACGEGRDTRELLRRGWSVLALDSHHGGLEMLKASTPPDHSPRLLTAHTSMEAIPLDPALRQPASLVNASFALPFCDPDAFPALWDWILARLLPGGFFSGQFFGDRDEWAPIRPRSHLSRQQLEKLLLPFDVLWCDEVDKDGEDALGGTKHHHLFHVVARRK